MITELVKQLFAPARAAVGYGASTLLNSFAPFIGSDNKRQYIEDYERVKYAFAVISFIAEKAAKVPFRVYRKRPEGRELQIDHRFQEILNRPNEYQSRFGFLFQVYGYLLSTGAAYIYIPKLSTGRFTEMHVIPSDYVEPVYERRFAGPQRFIITDTGQVVDKSEMMYIFRGQLRYEQVGVGENGLSPMKSLRTVIRKTEDIDKADLASIQNGGVAGILTDKSRDMAWGGDQMALIEKALERKAYGAANKGRWLLTSGDISWIPVGLSSLDLNLYEANKQVLRDICMVYRLPYIIFDQTDSNSSYGTAMDQARRMAYTDAILPAVEMLTDELNAFVMPDFGREFVLDYETSEVEELQKDQKTLAETLNAQWWKPIGQKQRESGMEVDERYEDTYLIPTGLRNIEDATMDLTLENELNDLEKAMYGRKA